MSSEKRREKGRQILEDYRVWGAQGFDQAQNVLNKTLEENSSIVKGSTTGTRFQNSSSVSRKSGRAGRKILWQEAGEKLRAQLVQDLDR